ncbi:MAG TPA: iron ABC transporter permease [Candidatus Bathyarchaeota archaeon]|nr:iron ABC transporter permease [Candidatus Bathyarchaeota archaeon]
MKLDTRKIEKLLSRPTCRLACDAAALIFFILVILLPTVFLFAFVALRWDEVVFFVFSNPVSGDIRWWRMLNAIAISFEVAAIATAIDLAVGLPIALILARYEFRGKEILDSLVDLPLGVPSAALGLSLYLFWGTSDGLNLLTRGFWLIVLTHVTFTFPYIVRSSVGVIEGVDRTYEHAARTLGAPSFTTFRTVTAPLSKAGLIAGSILAFTRSLGETGATLVVAGLVETAPLAVVSMHQRRLIGPAAFLSMLLVLLALGLLAVIKVVSEKVGIPIKRVWPGLERKLSGRKPRIARDIASLSFFGLMILIPSCFSISCTVNHWDSVFYEVFLAPDEKWKVLVDSLVTSFEVAAIATAINLIFGLAMAIVIVRRPWRRFCSVLDTITDMPLVIPTAALGFSVYLFWGPRGLGLVNTGFWLIVLTHVAFTYPYVVRTLVAALKGLDPSLEHAARTLGAPPFMAFRTVVLPLISTSMLAASILAFTRSLSETGATIVVMGTARTVPVLVVMWSEAVGYARYAAAFASVLLILVCYGLLLALRYVAKR